VETPVDNRIAADMQLRAAAFLAGTLKLTFAEKYFHLHQSSALTFPLSHLGWLASMAERVGFNKP